MRCFGNGERTVKFCEPLYDTDMTIKPAERAVNANNEMENANNRLSITNEAVMLPKSAILKCDGFARNFKWFLNSFDINIHCKSISDSAKLNILIQYCEGKAGELIEDCIMFVDLGKCSIEARALLKK